MNVPMRMRLRDHYTGRMRAVEPPEGALIAHISEFTEEASSGICRRTQNIRITDGR
jgi:hypothetical protein